jgi:hypothetical protein
MKCARGVQTDSCKWNYGDPGKAKVFGKSQFTETVNEDLKKV